MNKITSAIAMLTALAFPLVATAQDTPQQPPPDQQEPSPGQAEPTPTEPTTPTEPAAPAETDSGDDTDFSAPPEQQAQIRTDITALKVAPVTVDFAVDVGVVVPSTVVLQPLPASIVTLVPRWAGFLFFVLADGRIVVVEPAGLKVVAIVTA